MPSSGSGSGTPATSAVYSGGITAEPLPYTHLSLPRYAKIMGINPVHFSGGHGHVTWPLDNNRCEDIWVRRSWVFADHVSHADLADAILSAEMDIARILGYWPAPRFIAKEMHRVEAVKTRRGNSINTRWGKVIQPGRRAVTLLGTPTVAYSDPDGDSFYERATVTLSTDLTDACEIKVYFAGLSGAQEWEVRPVKSKSISGGTLTIVMDSWLLVNPTLLEEPPTTDGYGALDLSTTANYVETVDVYREYVDNTAASVEFWWENGGCCDGSGCVVCSQTTQNGCLLIRDVEAGIVVPTTGTYADGSWSLADPSVCRVPDQYKIWYYAGDLDEYYLRGDSCEPLSDFYAHAIAWMATARLERGLCSCGNVEAFATHLRQDLAFTGDDSSYNMDFELLGNPFGTRRGEVMAWNRISKMSNILYEAAVL